MEYGERQPMPRGVAVRSDISLCMITKDEEHLLIPLLAIVRPWVADMIVVDTGSTDHSVVRAKQAGAWVLTKDLEHDFSAARNYGLSHARTRWVMQIDTDEEPSLFLLEWLVSFVGTQASQPYDSIQVCRYNLLDDQPLAGREREWHTRVFRSHLRYTGTIHESIVGAQQTIKAPEEFLLRHAKTAAQQETQNRFYKEWSEQ